jgi:radical SAM-linked protein
MTEDARAAIRFRIAGTLRFLSHAETARVFQRAFARAGIPVRYSQGFNPHPRMSLPLPRPVGVEADEERLTVRLDDTRAGVAGESQAEREAALKQALAAQLPQGIEVLAVDWETAGTSLQPQTAEYVFPLRTQESPGLTERLHETAAQVMSRARCLVERAAAEGGPTRSVDVRPFLQSVRVENGNLIVQHGTGASGSIRVEEILQLFGLQTRDLAGPIRRTNVIWINRKS